MPGSAATFPGFAFRSNKKQMEDKGMFNLFKKIIRFSRAAIAQICHKKTPFIPIYKKITKDIIEGKILTPEGNRFAKPTGRNYKTATGRFEAYEKEYGIIYLEDINLEWAQNYIIFLMEQGYCKNTIADTLARLKALLRRLYNAGKCKYNGHGIRTSNEIVTAVYSSVEDIVLLLDCDLTYTPGFERVRDIYVLQCFVGLRYSDFSIVLQNPKQHLSEIGGKYFISIKTNKTGEVVVIPVARVVKQIFEKYQYNFGKVFSYQYYNESIKEIAQRAGITDEIVFTRTEGGQRIDTPLVKWSLMSSHTARRTFATNAFLSGMPEKNIMLITGHKTTQAFHRYVRCTSLDAAIKIANHAFFNIELPVTLALPESESKEFPKLPK